MNSLRQRLREPSPLIVPGVADALQARLVDSLGFRAVFLSGSAVSLCGLGRPDVGLVNQVEMVDRIAAICDVVQGPVIADGDNGHGNALNVIRTVRSFERAGAAAIMLEDQVFPKRCGHLAGARLVSPAEMVGKLRAAADSRRSEDFLIIGRTDARGVEGLSAAIDRAHLYREAGADVLFVEAPRSLDEMAVIGQAFHGIPLIANMVEGGASPQPDNAALAALGFDIVFYPTTVVRSALFAARQALQRLKTQGTTRDLAERMMGFGELNTLVGIERIGELEDRYVPPRESP